MKLFVAVTRLEPGLSETINQIHQLGFHTLRMPLMDVKPLKIKLDITKSIKGIIFTSRQAIKPTIETLSDYGIEHQHIPVYAVGKMTALDAEKFGFHTIMNANKDSEALLEIIKSSLFPSNGMLFYPTAKDKGNYLEQGLKKANFDVSRYEIYQTCATQALTNNFIEYLQCDYIHTVLFFSLQSVKNFIKLMPKNHAHALKNVNAIGISFKLYSTLKYFEWKRIMIAQQPNTDEMLSILRASHKD